MNSNLQERLVSSSRSLQFVQSMLVISIASREIYSLVTGLGELGEYIRLGLILLACLGGGFMIKYFIKERANLLVVARVGIATVTLILFFVKKWLEWEVLELFLAMALIQAYLETISIPRDTSHARGNREGSLIISSSSHALLAITFGMFLPYIGLQAHLKDPFVMVIALVLIIITVTRILVHVFTLKKIPGLILDLGKIPPGLEGKFPKIRGFFMRLLQVVLGCLYLVSCTYLSGDPKRLNLPFLQHINYFDKFLMISVIFWGLVAGWFMDYIFRRLVKPSIMRNTIAIIMFPAILSLGFLIPVPVSLSIPWSFFIILGFAGTFHSILNTLQEPLIIINRDMD